MTRLKQLLVVDDEENMRHLLQTLLEKEGYAVTTAENGRIALDLLDTSTFDTILCDLRMPEMDGMTFLKQVRDQKIDTTIIIMSAYGTIDQALETMQLGAYDYISKPFSPRVLIARIRTALRRQTRKPYDDTSVIQIHALEIHPGRRTVLADGKPIDLAYSEFQVLHFLSRRPGWVFTRSQIVDAVRGDDYPVTDRSVDVQIVGLRRKLGDCGKYIETVRGVGYTTPTDP